MSGLAGIVHWHGRPASSPELRRMLRMIRHRGPDGLEQDVSGGVGLGHARLALAGGEGRQRQPLWLPDRSCGVTADARLYNRDELRGALGRVEWLREPVSDAALILAGYERWREGVLARLHGDFAFAIWDAAERRVFAARDPFGSKPLFYAASAESLYLGSEPKQLLILPAVPVEPDARSVAGFLANRMSARRSTFFRGIERVRAGHYLSARAGGSMQRPYWEPRTEAPLPGRPDAAYRARLRELLFDAVERRLRTEAPVCFELSGGLDSSSLVISAGRLDRRDDRGLPVAGTISAVFPGREFDESPFIDAVAERVPFASHRISPIGEGAVPDLAEQVWLDDSPDADLGWAWKRAAGEILSALGARVLVAGTGGDELFWDPDYLPDLVARRRWALALRYCRAGKGRLRPAIAGGLAEARRLLGRGARRAPVPDWLRPELIEELGAEPVLARGSERPGLSRGQRTILDWLSEPRFHYVLEQNESRWSRLGVELRHPFLDPRLAEFVVATPIEIRASMAGAIKPYLTSALASDLPRALLDRKGKTAYDGYYSRLAERSRRRLADLFAAEEEWACERYVRRSAVRSLVRRAASPDAPWSAVRPAWALACLEVWLRQLARYEMMEGELRVQHPGDEVPEQSKVNRDDARDPEAPKQPYRKPELRQLGHMAEVTQKSGGGVDGGNPNARSMT